MDRSSNTLTERLQSAAERRAQIESAKFDRLSRSITAPAQQQQQQQQSSAMFTSTMQNPSLAFGSTRARNIDLNRPLVTPVRPAVRPRSEILPTDFNGKCQKTLLKLEIISNLHLHRDSYGAGQTRGTGGAKHLASRVAAAG